MTIDALSKSAYKNEYLRKFVSESRTFIPIIAITESWLKSYMSKAQVAIPNYSVHRSDRSCRSRGGVITYIHKDIPVGKTLEFDNKFCEVTITPMEKAETLLITVYRPPNCPHLKFRAAINFIQSALTSLSDSWTILISGDLNLPNINWETLCVETGLSSDSNSSADLLLSFLDRNGLGQLVEVNTRNDNTLDLLITNMPEIVLDIHSEDTLVSEHDWVTVTLGYDFSPSRICHPVRERDFNFSSFDFRRADYERLNAYLHNVDWDNAFNESPVNFSNVLVATLMQICHLCVPLKRSLLVSQKTKVRQKSGIYNLKRKRKKIKTRIKALQLLNPSSSRLSSLELALSSIDSKIKTQLLAAKEQQELKAISAIKENPGFFFSYAKKFSKVKSKIGPLKDKENKFISDPEEMANLFQTQFKSFFSDPQSNDKSTQLFLGLQLPLKISTL